MMAQTVQLMPGTSLRTPGLAGDESASAAFERWQQGVRARALVLWCFLIFYITCAALTWAVYSGLRDISHEAKGRRAPHESVTV